jgi:peptidoglycan-associated lipoprotein
VKHSKLQWTLVVVTLAAIMVLGGCHKKTQTAPPPPPPPPPQPTASLSANPTNIQGGQATTLTWQTSNATDVRIDPIGPADPSGSQRVTPADSTNYHLTAKGPGGTADATARVTVTAAQAAPPATAQVSPTDAELFSRNVKDVYFDYDAYTVRADGQQAVQGDAAFLKQHPNWKVTIEGHCDERGSTEYNLALGDNRARAVRDALVQAGVPASQLNAISYGKEKPFCTESNEACWQQNRVGHLVLGAGASR